MFRPSFAQRFLSILPIHQARAGQLFTQAVGVSRLREFSLTLQRRLIELFAARDVRAEGGHGDHGAFVITEHARAREIAHALRHQGVITDARGCYLRLCPDVLTTDEEVVRAVETAAHLLR